MAQFKNISGVAVWIPELQSVVANLAIITVTDADAEGFAGQTAVWQPQDTTANNAVTALANPPTIGGVSFIRAGR